MSLPRPTDEQIGYTLQHIHQIARQDSDAYWLVDHLVSLYAWLLNETHDSENGRAFGHGASDVHILTATTSDLEGRLYDPLLREQRRTKRHWLATLRQTGHRWTDDANNITKTADQYRNTTA